MKNRYLYIGSILFITLVVCNSWLYADEEALIQAQASIDKETISIGDTVTYTIVVKTKKNIDISFPTFGENFAGFAVKDFGSREEIFFGKKTIKKWYLLDTYVAGSYTIPPAIIKYHILSEEEVPQEEVLWSEIETNEVNVEVESVLLKADNDSDIYDIKNPVLMPAQRYWYFILTGVVVLLGIVISIFLFFKKRFIKKIIVPPRPAHEIAYEALDTLIRKDHVTQNEIKEYYSELSFIVRQYLENRFTIRAPEMTTEEFLITVKDAQFLVYEHKNLLKNFLEQSDMVKFAKYGPGPDEIFGSMEAAKRLIEQTKEVGGDKQVQKKLDDGM